MVDAVTTQILQDGPRHCVMKFTNLSDGTGEAAVAKVTVSSLESFMGKPCTGVSIRKIQYSTFGMTVNILWDATTDVHCISLPDNQWDTLDFEDSPLINNAGAGKNGNVLFTTVGHTLNDRYTVILHMLKNY